ncbi:hypothetical protein [Frondihabitans cladoniiphilus]|uniref:hypothetical protein n=1 Tax=Frondihabitans cladoniiphilus TaxID=715785 RepID=UPI0031ED310A
MIAALAVSASPANAATAAAVAATAATTAPATGEAPGSPGIASTHDQSRKDCVDTARNTTSKIWFTVANGVLSDVYAPTVDATNVKDLQYLVTDGSTFTDLQTRDTTYTVSSDPTGMTCTVLSTAKSKAYQLKTTYFADPARASVVARTTFIPLTKAAKSFNLYVRLDATAGGNGGGGATNAGATRQRSTPRPARASPSPSTRRRPARRTAPTRCPAISR